jgi:hypothetical protein
LSIEEAQYHSKYRVREMIEYRFRVLSAAVFTLYSYSKALEYRFRVPTAGSLTVKNPSTDSDNRVAVQYSRLKTKGCV